MALSTFTGITLIPERSEATPGLWNTIFSTISANLDTLNSDKSALVGSIGTTVSSVGFSSNTLRPETSNLTITVLAASGGASVALVAPLSTNTIRADSGATISILPSSTALILKSIDSGGQVLDVRAFGAVGNGVADDTTAVTNAIGSCTTGGVVYFPVGTYNISSTLTLSRPVNLVGPSSYGAIISYTTSVNTCLVVAGVPSGANNYPASYCARNLLFQGSSSTNATTGINISSFYFTMYDCSIQKFGIGLSFGSNANFFSANNCNWQLCNQSLLWGGPFSNAGENLRFNSCAFVNSQTWDSGIKIAGTSDIYFNLCSIDNTQFVQTGSRVVIQGTHFENLNNPATTGSLISQNAGLLHIAGSYMLVDAGSNNILSVISATDSGDVGNAILVVDGCYAFTSVTSIPFLAVGGSIAAFASAAARGFVSVVTGATTGPYHYRFGNFSSFGSGVKMAAALTDDGTALRPGYGFGSEASLGWYRSSASGMALSYGNLIIPSGAANIQTVTIGAADGVNNYLNADGLRISGDNVGDTIYNAGRNISITANSGQSIHIAKTTGGGFGFTQLTATGESLSTKGSGLIPGWGFQSDISLGWYSSASSVVALSYGGLGIKTGVNASCGTAVLGSNGSVNVATNYVATGDLIFLTDQTPGGTLGDIAIGGIRAGSGFTIQSTSVTDTSTVAWLIIRPT